MTNSSWERESRYLTRLRKHLDVYSAALDDWRKTMDQASIQVARLTAEQSDQLADEINEIRKNRQEYSALKKRVDEGWALYTKLSAHFNGATSHASFHTLPRSTRALN